eukprot:1959233-Prymnesium_polylepis.1
MHEPRELQPPESLQARLVNAVDTKEIGRVDHTEELGCWQMLQGAKAAHVQRARVVCRHRLVHTTSAHHQLFVPFFRGVA